MTEPNKIDYDAILTEASRQSGVPKELLYAQMMAESNGNPNAKSSVGAQGLFQLMPATAKELGVKNVWDPQENANAGARYLKQQYDKFGDWSHALAAYNAGPGNVKKYGGIPPFKETQNYIKKIAKRLSGGGGAGPEGAMGAGVNSSSYMFNPSIEDADKILGGTTGGSDSTESLISTGINFNPSAEEADQILGTSSSVALPSSEAIPLPEGEIPQPIPLLPGAQLTLEDQQAQVSEQLKGLLTKMNKDAVKVPLSAAKGFADGSGISFVERQIGKIPGVKTASEFLNNQIASIIGTPQMSFEERARQAQAGTQQAIAENPLTNIAGIIGGAVTGAPGMVGKGIQGITKVGANSGNLAKLTNLLLKGTGEAGAFEAVSNPDATLKSVATAGGIGAVTGLGISGLSKLTEKVPVRLVAKLLKTKDLSQAKAVLDEPSLLGVTTRDGLVTRAENLITTKADELNKVLTKKYASRTIDISNIDGLDAKSLFALAEKEAATPLAGTAFSDELLNFAAKIEKNSSLPVAEANRLKQIMWEYSRFTKGGDAAAGRFSQNAFDIGVKLKNKIESAIPEVSVKKLNKSIQTGIRVRNALKDVAAPPLFGVSDIVKGGAAGYISPDFGTSYLAAKVLGKTVPGISAVAKASKGLKTISEADRNLIRILLPQAAKQRKVGQ